MKLLSAPYELEADASGVGLTSRLTGLVAAVAGLTVFARGLELLVPGGGALGAALQLGAVHGGLVAAGFLLSETGAHRACTVGVAVTAALIGAAWLGAAAAWGWLAFGGPPIILGLSCLRPGHRGNCSSAAVFSARSALLGLLVGGLLGVHLLVTASLTLGHRVGRPMHAYLLDLAYDIGANALTAAWFFYGTLFSFLWRRLDFWRSTALATAAAMMRYLLDPALPRASDGRAGAVFYLAVLGIVCCALRAHATSAVPAYAAVLGFFAAYRALSGW